MKGQSMAQGYRTVVHVRKKDKAQVVYRYATATGERLHGDPDSWSFKADVRASQMRGPTMQHLLKRYRSSMRWRELSQATKRNYEKQMLIWDAEGELPLKAITRPMLSAMRDDLLDTPGVASLFVGFTKMLLNFAVEEEMIEVNPALTLKKPKLGTIKRWPDDRIEEVIKGMPLHIATPCMLALYLGQRLGDVLAMRWSDYKGATVVVKQEKTGMDEADTSLEIPCHSALQAFLDGLPREHDLIAVNSRGKPWGDTSNYSGRLREQLHRVGMEDYSIHGLRKSAANRLAEAGCSSKEIAAILGHKTLAMVELYTREVEQRQLAVAAIEKLERAQKRA